MFYTHCYRTNRSEKGFFNDKEKANYKAPNKTRANYAINWIVNRFPYVNNNYYPQVAYCS